jgi:hypothetical protein
VEPPPERRAAIAVRHYRETVEHYAAGHGGGRERGIALGVRTARKHVAAYVRRARAGDADGGRAAAAALCQLTDPGEVAAGLAAAMSEEGMALAA